MEIFGNDWGNYSFKSTSLSDIGSKEYNIKDIYNIYSGNICLDLGSLVGSISFYHRSIQIIEAGGLIIQGKQSDSKESWGKLYDKLVFNDINGAKIIIENILDNKEYRSNLFNEIYNKFEKSEKLIENSLQKIFSNKTTKYIPSKKFS